jgi:hypothetical protein
MLHIGMGNNKIDDSVGIFDLPEVTTCPGAGECVNYCYAIKQAWWGKGYPTALNRTDNWRETYKPSFVHDMVNHIKKHKIKVFRPHMSGDFYDQDYVDKWALIARKCPKTVFFAYTKSLNPHINLTPLTTIPTHNFTLIYSEGGKYDSKIKKTQDNYATVKGTINDKTIAKGEYVCPDIRSSGKKTEKYCGYNCDYCTSDRDTKLTKTHQIRVVFYQRMGGWTGTILFPRPPSHLIRSLPPLSGAPQTRKTTQPTKIAWPRKVKGGDPKAYRAELAKAVEAAFAYRHLLLAGFTEQDILQRTGLEDLSELRREHALKLMKEKVAAEEAPPFVLLHKKRKRHGVKHGPRRKSKSASRIFHES